MTVPFLLNVGLSLIDDHLDTKANVLIPDHDVNVLWGVHDGLALRTRNSNGQRMTWGILSEAIMIVYNAMNYYGFGTAHFTIFDGVQEVGVGQVATHPPAGGAQIGP